MQEKNELIKLVSESNSLSEILRKQGKAVSGSSLKILKNNLKDYKIEYYFLNNTTFVNSKNPKPLEEVLVKNSNYSSSRLKGRLI